jgi:hypothetical protein
LPGEFSFLEHDEQFLFRKVFLEDEALEILIREVLQCGGAEQGT